MSRICLKVAYTFLTFHDKWGQTVFSRRAANYLINIAGFVLKFLLHNIMYLNGAIFEHNLLKHMFGLVEICIVFDQTHFLIYCRCVSFNICIEKQSNLIFYLTFSIYQYVEGNLHLLLNIIYHRNQERTCSS